VYPRLGRLLLRAALRDCPVRLGDAAPSPPAGAAADVAFVIGHRGRDRLPHLEATLRSIAGQAGVSVECIVVEQDARPTVRDRLPAWVRHVHTPPPHAALPYCRAWAFNVGARLARSPLLILHDNDMLVPARYAAEALRVHRAGYEVANLMRLVFYLSPGHTEDIFAGRAALGDRAPALIVQNLEAGGSLCVDRAAYLALGGMDEAFIGWGGEDNEFWERALTRRAWEFASLPVVHLWHPPQPGKGAVAGRGADTAALSEARARVPVADRIAELGRRDFGNPRALDPAPMPRGEGRLAARARA
jgi:hypothetical protein